MGRLTYMLNVSLDGYVETPDHGLEWALVDDELHKWFNDRESKLDALLYGRRLYELMADYWPTAESDASATDTEREYGRIWLAKPKIVFSSSLERVEWNSRLVRGDPVDELTRVREEFDGDLGLGGATLATSFIRQGLVDEYQLVVHPVVLGAGTPYLPPLDSQLALRLVDTHVFNSGVTYLAYRPA